MPACLQGPAPFADNSCFIILDSPTRLSLTDPFTRQAQPPHSAGPQVPAAGALPSSAVKAADPHAALALPGLSPTAAASVAATDSSPSSPPVVVVTCAASDRSPDDLITPWSQAVVAAGVPHVLLVSDDAGCVAAAKAVGIKVLQHSFQVRQEPRTAPGCESRISRR